MATLYATNKLTGVALTSSAAQAAFRPMAGSVGAMVGTYEIAANPTANDVIRFGRLPKGAIVIGGWMMGDDIDTGTETFDIDIGWEANGTDSADTDGFGNFGVLSGDVITELKPVAGIYNPLQGVLLADGPKTFAAETWVSGLVIAAANATGTGTLTVVVLYVVP